MVDVPSDLAALLQNAYRYALALTHDEGLADDVLQEACVGVLHAKAPWNERYLFTAVRNRHIDHCRRQRSQKNAAESANHVLRVRSDRAVTRPLSPVELDDRRSILHDALGALRPEEREVLFLHAVAGHSAHAIGTLTGRPRSTVLSLLQRGRRKLAEMLHENALEV